MAITSDGMLLGPGVFQEIKKNRICLNERKEAKKKKKRRSGIELYSVSRETENEQMAIKNAEIYKYEKNKEFYDYKSGSSWLLLVGDVKTE